MAKRNPSARQLNLDITNLTNLRVGIEIGGTKLQLAVGVTPGKIEACRRMAVDRAKGAAGIRTNIAQALPGLLRDRKPDKAGVGFGGPVDWTTGRVSRSHHVEGWSDFDLRAWLEGLTGAPVVIDNDANVAALGEAKFGAGRGMNPIFYVTLGSGVGGGLVVDGRIYHGAPPGESEIGHVRLDRNGATVESRCSGWAIDRRIRELNASKPDGLLARLTANSAAGDEARHLVAALTEADPDATRILCELSSDLAFGLSHIVHLLHPQAIVLGGGLSGIGEPLRAGVELVLRESIMDAFKPAPRVLLAALGRDAVPVGALALE